MRSSSLVLRHWCLRNWKSTLILNPNRLRTFEGARLEVVTYVEAKFGLRIHGSKPSGMGSRGPSDPMDVDAVTRPDICTLGSTMTVVYHCEVRQIEFIDLVSAQACFLFFSDDDHCL